MMRRYMMGLLAIVLVMLSASPLLACHHRRRGCGGECGCASTCGSEASCGSSCTSCSTGCTTAIPNVDSASLAAAHTVYTAPVASAGRWQPTPPPQPPTDPHANLALTQSRINAVGK
jgi:hypothetical protein